jgi:hypothetical protein
MDGARSGWCDQLLKSRPPGLLGGLVIPSVWLHQLPSMSCESRLLVIYGPG